MKYLISGALMVLTIGQANAQARCAPRDIILDAAYRQYQERPIATALAAGGVVLEVLATREGATFTVLQTRPDGTSCVIAVGESWEPKTWQMPDREVPES